MPELEVKCWIILRLSKPKEYNGRVEFMIAVSGKLFQPLYWPFQLTDPIQMGSILKTRQLLHKDRCFEMTFGRLYWNKLDSPSSCWRFPIFNMISDRHNIRAFLLQEIQLKFIWKFFLTIIMIYFYLRLSTQIWLKAKNGWVVFFQSLKKYQSLPLFLKVLLWDIQKWN